MAVGILDTRKKPLMPCSEKRARVHHLVGRLREKSAGHVWVRHDPDSQTAGVALVGERESSGRNERHREQTVLELLERAPRGQAIVTKRKKAGTCLGRVAIRARGRVDIQTRNGLAPGIPHRFRALVQRADGHGYSLTKITLDKGEAGMERALSAVLSLPGIECQGFPRK